MTDLREEVALPDPAEKQLLRPTDLPEARGLCLRGWCFARLCALPVVVAIGGVTWAATGNLFASLVASSSTFLIAFFAGRELQRRAWDYVPRKRQDSSQDDRLVVAGALVDALALLVTAGAVVVSLDRRPVPGGVVSFAVGSALGIALIQAVQLVVSATRRESGVTITAHVIMIVAVASATALVASLGAPSGSVSVWNPVTAAGAATPLLTQAIWLAFTRTGRQ